MATLQPAQRQTFAVGTPQHCAEDWVNGGDTTIDPDIRHRILRNREQVIIRSLAKQPPYHRAVRLSSGERLLGTSSSADPGKSAIEVVVRGGYQANRWFRMDEQVALPMPSDLQDALQELGEVPADAQEDGLVVPSDLAFQNAQHLLKAMYRISPQRFGVYPVSDGYIAIDARGINDRISVVMCGSDGEVLCLVTIDGEHRRARYSTAEGLPDGFIREALFALRKEPSP